MSLFLPADVSFEKTAYTRRLSGATDQWPVEIVKEAYRQLPFLKAYETEVEMDKSDGSMGFGLGKLSIFPLMLTKEKAAQDEKLVTVPVIVRDRELAPLDVYAHGGDMHPMDGEELQSLLFRPGVFEGPAPKGTFGGQSMNTSPPNSRGGVQTKTASILKIADASDIERRVLHGLHPMVRARLLESPLTAAALEEFQTKTKTASDAVDLPPTVMQVYKHGRRYLVKKANHTSFRPSVQEISHFELSDAVPEHLRKTLEDVGSVTIVKGAIIKEAASVKSASDVTRPGRYRVWAGADSVDGYVVPDVIMLDGTKLNQAFFIGKDKHAMQEKIAGVHLDDDIMDGGKFSGRGMLFYQAGTRGFGIEPMEVLNRMVAVEGSEKVASFRVRRLMTGSEAVVQFVPGLQKIAHVDGTWMLPALGGTESAAARLVFIPLPKETTSLATEKIASSREARDAFDASSISLVSDGSCYSFRGTEVFGQFLDQNESAFALGALGLGPAQIDDAMSKAASQGIFVIPKTRTVTLKDDADRLGMAKVAAVARVSRVPSANLFNEASVLFSLGAMEKWKTAGVIVRKETPDAILSLNFVTPENAAVYVDYIPEIEKAASKVAELLIASRMGMDDVRESAAKNAMGQMQQVLNGLYDLRGRIQ